MASDPPVTEAELAKRGYAVVYNGPRAILEAPFFAAFPGLFVKLDKRIWAHRAGEALVLAVRRALAITNETSPIKAIKELAVKREVLTAIAHDFDETAIRALVETTETTVAATTIAERALWRVELLRNGKLPPWETKSK